MSYYSEYKYNIIINSDDLPDLNKYLQNSSMASKFAASLGSQNNVTIMTKKNLTTDEISQIETLIKNFQPVQKKKIKSSLVTFSPCMVNSIDWQEVYMWSYPGSVINPINGFKFIASINDSTKTYYVRLYDTTNNNVIFDYSGNNTDIRIISITSLQNVPMNATKLRFVAKVSAQINLGIIQVNVQEVQMKISSIYSTT